MIDNTRIKSGYDVEVLLGADYFLTIFQAAHEAGQIPASFQVAQGDQLITVTVARPHDAAILQGDDANLELTMGLTIELPDAAEPINIDAGVEFLISFSKETGVSISFVRFDSSIRGTLVSFVGEEKVLELEESLRASSDKTLQVDFSEAEQLVQRVLPGQVEPAIQPAIALYLNLNLKVASQDGPPESEFIERGNADLGVSFLVKDRAYAIGVSPQTFERFANDAFHGFFQEGENSHPLLQDGKPVGEYKSIRMEPKDDGFVRITVRFRGFVKHFPDAPVKVEFNLRSSIVDGRLHFDVELENFDADAGLLGDVIAYLCGGALAVIALAILGPGAVVLMPILQSGAIVGIEIIANRKGDENEGTAAEGGDDIRADVSSAFSAFPTRVELFVDKRDQFFTRHLFLQCRFQDVVINKEGMSMSGRTFIDRTTFFPQTDIKSRSRGTDADSRLGISTLTYRLHDFINVTLTMAEVFRRISKNEIARVDLEPTNTRRSDTIVTDIKFESGVDFSVAEIIALDDERIIRLPGYQIIDPKGANVYVRSAPDKRKQNNLEELPTF